MTLLAGDLGGTKTLLGLFAEEDGTLLHSRRFDSHAYEGLDAMVTAFLSEPQVQEHPRPARATFGVAGPVEEIGDRERPRQRATITNLRWGIDTASLEGLPGLLKARLVNDFYAVAAATAVWAQDLWRGVVPRDVVALNPAGCPRPGGPIAILGAGTGLGEAIITPAPPRAGGAEKAVQVPMAVPQARPIPSTGGAIILPTEGGHSDFAARDELEIELFRFLQRRHGPHVSYERVLSGAGMLALYEFLREYRGRDKESAEVAAALARDPAEGPAIVSQRGLVGSDPLSSEALDRFVSIYGAEAGNLALKALATGGVFVAGGIAPKILPRLQAGGFLEGFLAKGRFSSLCASLPVYVIVNPEAGLFGALVLAGEM